MSDDAFDADAFDAELAERGRVYRVWRDGLIAKVREAIEADRGFGGSTGLHSRLLDKVELVLTAVSAARDEDGVLIGLPGTRKLCRWLLVELAKGYGIEADV